MTGQKINVPHSLGSNTAQKEKDDSDDSRFFGQPVNAGCLRCKKGVKTYISRPLPSIHDTSDQFVKDLLAEKFGGDIHVDPGRLEAGIVGKAWQAKQLIELS